MSVGIVQFPGITDPQYLIATRSTGMRPDVAVLYSTPWPSDSADCSGTASLVFGFNGINITWQNALCDSGTTTRTTHGDQRIYTILDSRWRWTRSYVTGAYNIRQSDGTIDTSTQQTLAQIATILFTAVGVLADVSAITSTEEPEIVFDRDNAADALEELLNNRGYVVALNLDETVTVYERGTGTATPNNGDVVTAAMSVNPPVLPNFITACGRWTVVQSKLQMQAVGIETDGRILPVNSLSYTPSGGWAGTDLVTFNNISSQTTKDLCKMAIGKWYQVVNQADGSFDLNFGGTNYNPGQFAVTSAFQYLPLEPSLLTSSVNAFGKETPDEPFVEGVFFDALGVNPTVSQNTAAFTRVDKRDWKLDRELGIVKFREPALQMTPGPRTGQKTFADVYLTCSYSVHDNVSNVKDRYTSSVNLGGIGEDLMKVDEIERQIILGYAANSSTVNSLTDNKSAMDTLADLYLNQMANQYQVGVGNIILYRGIYQFNVDGVNLQIKWDCAVPGRPAPFGTTVSQYCEGISLMPTRRERALHRQARMSGNAVNRRVRQFKNGKKSLNRRKGTP